VRHGKAEAGPVDAERRLTAAGRDDVETLARSIARTMPDHAVIEHSPLIRAKETAAILAEATGLTLVERSDLLPGSDPGPVRDRLVRGEAESVALVGHNPFMELMAGMLIGDDSPATPLTFRTASAARFVSVPGSIGWRFSCEWLISRQVLPGPPRSRGQR
jgi:phosphohistidine phosphatase SixA